jgi:predicted nucleic acid-binding protein
MVVDASVLIEVLLGTGLGKDLAPRLFEGDPVLHAPHVIDLEVLQVLRALLQAKEITPDTALGVAARLQAFDLVRHAHDDLIPRIFDLRHNLTAYDAAYLALAEALDVPLVTCDGAFDGVPGRRASVEVWKATT